MKIDRQIVIFILQVLLAIAFALFIKFCSAPDQVTNTITKETTFIYDSTQKSIPVPQAPASVSVFTVAVPVLVDTAEVLRRYFASYTYTQQIKDSSISAVIFDSVSQNRILKRKFEYKWLQPVRSIESTTITLPAKEKAGIYLGGFIDHDQMGFGAGPKISYQTKKNLVIGYDFEAFNKGHRISLQQKIKW